MVNINQSEDKNEEFKLSPLGTDEINSVIKSFKNSTFNQEELYKKDEKNFVKKTLFDLAKESERISSEENQSETDNSSEENVGASQEIVKDTNKNDGPDNIHSFNDIDENNKRPSQASKNKDIKSLASWISSQNQNYYFNLKFNKNDKLSRENQDELINISILFVLKKYIDNKYEFKNIKENLNSVFSKLDSSLIFEEGN